MNNRAQFFLIAAVIIVFLVSSLVVVHNKAESKKEDSFTYDLEKEIVYESGKTFDVGTFQAKEDSQVNSEIENLSDSYSKLNPKTDFVFIYGNESEVVFLQYDSTDTGGVSISFGGNAVEFDTEQTRRQRVSLPRTGNALQLNLDEARFEFNLRQGKNFFTLLKKENEGERFVAVSEE